MNKTTLVILAAGLGSRYGGLKQMEPISENGDIIADFSLYDAKRAGFDNAVFVIKKQNESDFKERIIDRAASVFDVGYVFQEDMDLPEGFAPPEDRIKPWGTGHALYAARNSVYETFAVINADDFYGYDTFEKLASFLKTTRSGVHCMVGFALAATVTEHGSVCRGICKVDNTAEPVLVSIDETVNIRCKDGVIFTDSEDGGVRELDKNAVVSMNAWGFHKSALAKTEASLAGFLRSNGASLTAEFYLPAAVRDMIDSGDTVRVLSSCGKWCGVTYKEDAPQVKAQIADLIKNGEYPKRLW